MLIPRTLYHITRRGILMFDIIKPHCVRRFGLGIMALCMGLLLSSCGLKKDMIRINYNSNTKPSIMETSKGNKVEVLVSDSRIIKGEVGKKGNEYGFLGAIVAENDVSEVVGDAIKKELEDRGFVIKPGGLTINTDIAKYYNEFKGVIEKSIAELIINVQVRDKNGKILYSKTIIGEGVNPNVFIRSGENAKQSLEAALTNAMEKLFSDEAFLKSLIVSG